jgi:glyoxylase-like metal-dependent hydrolase (beta-lactamase superfamily II)
MKVADRIHIVGSGQAGFGLTDDSDCHVYLLDGGDEYALIDAGGGRDTAGIIAGIEADGLDPARVRSLLITHGHADHTEGSPRLHELLGGTPVRAADPAHTICGDPLTAGTALDAGLTVRVVPTPGHTADSVCFLVEHGDERVVLTGDTILGRGTTVVAKPDGHLGDYLSSLELLSTHRGVPALPGHGPALADCGAAAEFYLAHRRARLDQVRAAVAAGATTASEVVATVYADVDRSLWPAAEWAVQAQLDYLAERGV